MPTTVNPINQTTGGGGGTETTRYWNDQGLTKVLPSGEPVEYKYDGVGRPVGRKDADGEQIFVQSGWNIDRTGHRGQKNILHRLLQPEQQRQMTEQTSSCSTTEGDVP